jgi:hypothetical protein
MDVNFREGLFEGTAETNVKVAFHTGRKSRLDAHLRRAKVPRLDRAANDFFFGQIVAFGAAVGAAKGTEAAPLYANVGKVYVTVHNVCDYFAHALPP